MAVCMLGMLARASAVAHAAGIGQGAGDEEQTLTVGALVKGPRTARTACSAPHLLMEVLALLMFLP